MIDVVANNLDAIGALCREYDVARLDLFGSAATSDFVPGKSDIDFLVDYTPDADLGPWIGRHFELQKRLSCLLGAPVDLVMAGGITNRFLIRAIDSQRQELYAA